MLLTLVSGLITIYSPFFGLILWAIKICDLVRKTEKELWLNFLIYAMIMSVGSYYLATDTIRLIDCLFGIGVGSLLFTFLYQLGKSRYAFSVFALYECCYGFVRKVIFADYFTTQVNFTKQQLQMIVEQPYFQGEGVEEHLLANIDLYFKYIDLFWVIPVFFALTLGILINKKNSIIKVKSLGFVMPINLIYVMIFSLVMALIPQTREYGMLFTVGFMLLSILQGIPIVWFWLIRSVYHNTVLRILTYVIILLNINLFLIISGIVGLVDNWFTMKNGVE